MEKDEVFGRYETFIEEHGIQGSTIILWDDELGRSAEVVLKDIELHCRLDESKDRVRFGFAYSLSKVSRIMAGRGVADEWVEAPNSDYDPNAKPEKSEIWVPQLLQRRPS